MEIFDNGDTICAISTPSGVGGIAVVRISGNDAIAIADRIWKGKSLAAAQTHTAHLGEIIDSTGNILDQAVATVFRAPRSFTGEDTVELSVHGSKWIQRETLNALIQQGARLAQAGEFTRRAFLSGRLDLAEAEAVADLIASSSRASHRNAINQMKGTFSRRLLELREKLIDLTSLLELELDFSEEDVEFASREKLRTTALDIRTEITRLAQSFRAGAAIKDGIPVAIVGPTNAGKSSLLNILLGEDRAIVSDIHGTTRDIIEDTTEIGDYLFRFMDTAGLRLTDDTVENMGIERSIAAASKASIIICVLDSTDTNPETTTEEILQHIGRADSDKHIILALNKTELTPTETSIPLPEGFAGATLLHLSAKTGQGIDSLNQTLTHIADEMTSHANGADDTLVSNARHAAALRASLPTLERVLQGLSDGLSGDLIAQDLRETLSHLASITGQITTPDILATIFSRFCIGK